MKVVFVVTALLLSGVSAYADTVCEPTANGGFRCRQQQRGCEWTPGGCR